MIDGLEPGDLDVLARIRRDIYECGHADREEGDEHALDRILAALEKAQTGPKLDFERMVQWAYASARERLAIPEDVRETLRAGVHELGYLGGSPDERAEWGEALAWLDAAPQPPAIPLDVKAICCEALRDHLTYQCNEPGDEGGELCRRALAWLDKAGAE